MGKERGNDSLLYRLYRQCADYLNREEKEPGGPSVFPDLFTGKGSGTSALERKEQQVSAEADAVGKIPCVPTLPEERKYLEPLLELKAVLDGNTECGRRDMEALEAHLFEMVRKSPFYPELCGEAEAFARELSAVAAVYQRIMTPKRDGAGALEDGEGREQEAAAEKGKEPFPADIRFHCSHDALYALVFLFPAAWGGKTADSDRIVAALQAAGLSYGLVAESAAMLASGRYDMQILLIAKGTAPVDGRAGEVIEKYPRTEGITIQQDEHGKADFKNLNSIQSIRENQAICEIIPPTAGLPGTDVYGNQIRQKEGLAPYIPAGKNTRITEDGLRLVAASSGRLLFKNGCFEVTQVLIIQSDVDYSVGNLDFPGDIVILGEVQTGFTVKAAGSVTVHGTVEGAAICSGGDVILKKGMNGSYEGEIHAEGEVKANFLENCKVYANGSVYANSIISCQTYSGDGVYAEGSIGAVVGGSVTALYTVSARTIGNKNLKETVITLGTAPKLLAERKVVLKEQKEVLDTLAKLDKNLDYLHRNMGAIPTDKLEVLTQLEVQQRMYRERKKQLAERIEELDGYQMNFSKCRLKSNMIFPATKVNIGPYLHVFDSVALRCSVFLSEDGIVTGSL